MKRWLQFLPIIIILSACANPLSSNYKWSIVTDSAEFNPGYNFSLLEFKDSIWLLNGQETWESKDLKHWMRVNTDSTVNSVFNKYVVFKNALYAIGGSENWTEGTKKAVWKSIDGHKWEKLKIDLPWSSRAFHSCIVFQNKIWLIGGYDGKYLNDVWYSEDGQKWALATAEAPWKGRCMHTLEIFNNKLYLIGGRRNMEGTIEKLFNDVWYTEDGINWQKATGKAFSKRYSHESVVFDNKLWVIGGSYFSPKNDSWFTEDGNIWHKELSNAPWSKRFGAACIVKDNKLYLIGGKVGQGKFKNDVWQLASKSY